MKNYGGINRLTANLKRTVKKPQLKKHKDSLVEQERKEEERYDLR